MKEIKLYTKSNCPFCIRAKALLSHHGLEFEEIDLTDDPEGLEALKTKTGWRTVPQIFIDGQLIGGFQELAALESNGGLDT